jgi:anaerobic magnesium-protoporphyrin IX monomethyl ester cyclase
MKVALIAPPYPLEESPSPPLGICYAAASFEDAGARVRIFDFIVRKYTPEKLKKELDAFNPDVVGANSVTMNFPVAAGILKTVKKHNPSIITMMGGPHVTFDADITLTKYPEIDVVALGESELTIKELLPRIRDRRAWEAIRGIAFLKDGQVVNTGPREFIQDLDSLPVPSRHLLPVSRYMALGFPVSIITSRGCPNQCIFCQGRRMVGQKVRYRDPVLVVDEIESILAYGFTRINIADDFFTSNKKRVRLICDEIIKRGIKFEWSAFARVDSVDKDCLKIMMDAGCDTVSFGIESGNPEMLKRVKKRITLDQARNAVQACKDVGMKIFASFMVGLPGESQKTLNDTHNFAEELDIDYGYHYLAPFPGTTLKENLENFDLNILTDDWEQYDANRAIVGTSNLTPQQLEAFVGKYNNVCEQESKNIEKRYKNGEASGNDIIWFEGKQKLDLIFRLLSEDIIEDNAVSLCDNLSNDHVADLLEGISGVMEIDPFVGERTIKNLIDSGYLKYEQIEGEIRWFWTHNSEIDELPIS